MRLKYAGKLREGKYGRLEVHHDKLSNRWYAHVSVEIKTEKISHPQPTSLVQSTWAYAILPPCMYRMKDHLSILAELFCQTGYIIQRQLQSYNHN